MTIITYQSQRVLSKQQYEKICRKLKARIPKEDELVADRFITVPPNEIEKLDKVDEVLVYKNRAGKVRRLYPWHLRRGVHVYVYVNYQFIQD